MEGFGYYPKPFNEYSACGRPWGSPKCFSSPFPAQPHEGLWGNHSRLPPVPLERGMGCCCQVPRQVESHQLMARLIRPPASWLFCPISHGAEPPTQPPRSLTQNRLAPSPPGNKRAVGTHLGLAAPQSLGSSEPRGRLSLAGCSPTSSG